MSDDILHYIKIGNKNKVLSQAEERALLTKAQGNPKDPAWELLVKHNLRLVISIAKRYTNKGLTFEDLIQEGMLGLMDGIAKFDMTRTFNGKYLKLSTYATSWIKQRITRALANTSRLIRIPVHILNEYPLVQRLYGKFREQWGVYPNSDELSILYNKAIEIDPKKRLKPKTTEEIAEIGRYFRPPSSLDQVNSEDENLTILDYVIDESTESPEGSLETVETKKYVLSLIDKLSQEDKIFISILYGLFDGKAKNRKSMSLIRKMSDKELLQKEQDILNELRNLINKDIEVNKFTANVGDNE